VFAVDWASVAGAGAFVGGIIVGAFLTIRLTRLVWEHAVRAGRRLEDDEDTRRPPT
jgi:hypothetical protein